MTRILLFIFLFSLFISCSDNNTQNGPLKQMYLEANKGNPEAQFKLGYKYYFGDEVPMNKDSSKYWLNKAAENGHVIAKKTYDGFFKIIPGIMQGHSIKKVPN
jgi:TPR repeat protein